jgi:hypothetical protein
MSDATTTEPKVEPPSLVDAIDFTDQIKLVLYAVQGLASDSGMFVLNSDSFWPVIHGVNGLSQYLVDLQEKLDEVHEATRTVPLPLELQEKLNKVREATRARRGVTRSAG